MVAQVAQGGGGARKRPHTALGLGSGWTAAAGRGGGGGALGRRRPAGRGARARGMSAGGISGGGGARAAAATQLGLSSAWAAAGGRSGCGGAGDGGGRRGKLPEHGEVQGEGLQEAQPRAFTQTERREGERKRGRGRKVVAAAVVGRPGLGRRRPGHAQQVQGKERKVAGATRGFFAQNPRSTQPSAQLCPSRLLQVHALAGRAPRPPASFPGRRKPGSASPLPSSPPSHYLLWSLSSRGDHPRRDCTLWPRPSSSIFAAGRRRPGRPGAPPPPPWLDGPDLSRSGRGRGPPPPRPAAARDWKRHPPGTPRRRPRRRRRPHAPPAPPQLPAATRSNPGRAWVISVSPSYADKRRRELEFSIGDHVVLKVSPTKGVKRFGIRGKLSPRFIGPYEVLERIGPVAYRLALPPILSGVHNVFHVSTLRKYVFDPTHILESTPVDLQEDLSFE
uniref:Tf2-1-like SH3-like domain-containing protein n=1 Tax=Ananas comosus var. bracteatus TaxID=296719 RepID=A0A6V7Q793_ANACO|nr:unnamed protein product [Ananas comosus var. bracteatus]